MSKYEKLNQPTRGNAASLAGDLDEVARQGALRMLREVCGRLDLPLLLLSRTVSILTGRILTFD